MRNEQFNGVSVYNPALLSREELKRYFVTRQSLLKQILNDLSREKPGHTPQHRLLLGLRGMGKTTLLHRLAIGVEEDENLNSRWLPLTFPEDQYNIANLADLWLNCLDALSDKLEQNGHITETEQLELDHKISTLARSDAETALAVLLEQADKQGKRLLLLVDNIDLVFERLKKQLWVLRETLQAESRLLIIGASSAAIEASYQYDAAFYDFFKVDELKGLSEKEMWETLLHLASMKQNVQIKELIEQDAARIKTLHTLTDGNPRTTVLLYNVLAQEIEKGDVRSDLDGLLDQLTPNYKARFEDLSEQAQQMIDALAINWDPMSANQLAEKLGWEVNKVSAQLNRLQQLSLVEKQPPAQGKRHLFQLGERFFNIWYLMRASRRVRWKLIWLVHFLRMFFSADQLQDHNESVEDQQNVEYNLTSSNTENEDLHSQVTKIERLVKSNHWSEAKPYFKHFIEITKDEFLPSTWLDIMQLFREIITIGKASEALKILDETGAGERWRPLREALMVIVSGNDRYLNCVAPEIREPAQTIVEQLT